MKNALATFRISEKAEGRSFSDLAALAIATCGGVGYIPIVPATWGSLFGITAFLATQKLALFVAAWSETTFLSQSAAASANTAIFIVSLIILFLAGTLAANRVIQTSGEKDPRIVVIDEVVGQLIVFSVIPFNADWWMIATGFITFRIFDIWKPYPANILESLPTGLGVMSDDIAAGIYATAAVSIIYWLSLTII